MRDKLYSKQLNFIGAGMNVYCYSSSCTKKKSLYSCLLFFYFLIILLITFSTSFFVSYLRKNEMDIEIFNKKLTKYLSSRIVQFFFFHTKVKRKFDPIDRPKITMCLVLHVTFLYEY